MKFVTTSFLCKCIQWFSTSSDFVTIFKKIFLCIQACHFFLLCGNKRCSLLKEVERRSPSSCSGVQTCSEEDKHVTRFQWQAWESPTTPLRGSCQRWCWQTRRSLRLRPVLFGCRQCLCPVRKYFASSSSTPPDNRLNTEIRWGCVHAWVRGIVDPEVTRPPTRYFNTHYH